MPMLSEILVTVENRKIFNFVADLGEQCFQKAQIAELDDLGGLFVHVVDQKVTDLRIARWQTLGVVSQKE